MQRHAQLLSRIEQRFGVPATLVMAIWTLEPTMAAATWKAAVVRTLASLAWDCRRSDCSRGELIAALRSCSAATCRCAIWSALMAARSARPQFCVVLRQIRRRLRRQRPRRPAPLRADVLASTPSVEGQRLRPVSLRHHRISRLMRNEPFGDLPQDLF